MYVCMYVCMYVYIYIYMNVRTRQLASEEVVRACSGAFGSDPGVSGIMKLLHHGVLNSWKSIKQSQAR